MELDNLDLQILGYINQNPAAMYGKIADVLGCQKIIINRRVQELYANGYIFMLESGMLELTEKVNMKSSYAFDYTENPDSSTEFNWDELYIPLNL